MRLSRRTMLRVGGAGTLAAGLGAGGGRLLPFLPAAARAAAAPAPQRLLVVFSPMGYLERSFWPTPGPGADFTLGETMSALVPFKNKLIFPDGLLMYGAQWFFPDDDNEHGSGMAMAFTASKKQSYATGPSIDQVVANHLYAQQRTSFQSLALGINAPAPSGHTSCFFTDSQKPVNPQNNPTAAFNTLFKNLQVPAVPPAPGGTQPAMDFTRVQKQSVIDLVRAELTDACGRIGAQEKDKCDAHLAALRDIELRLQPAGTGGSGGSGGGPTTVCTKPPAPAAGGDLAAQIHQQMDIITAAFTCDLTRVATLQLGFCDGGLDMIPGINQHDTTHAVGDTKCGAAPVDAHKKIDKWFADRWAYLFGKLQAVQEANGSLLDNTLILFGSDTTTGTSYECGAHEHWRFPYWLAGGGNFAFPTGRYLQLPHPTNIPGSPTDGAKWATSSRLFVSILQKFGINQNTFGNMDPGSGPLAML